MKSNQKPKNETPAATPNEKPASETPAAPTNETPTAPANETAPVTADEIVEPLGERMPPVTESANQPTEAPASETPAPASGSEMRDAKGVRFDPFRHQTNDDGSPRRNAKGNFMLKNDYRLGRIRRDPNAAPRAVVDRGNPSFAENDERPAGDQFDAAAEVYLQAAYGPLQIAFGPEIKADKDDHATLKTALANYLRATGATELSPGWALTVTIAAFAAKKASVPTVQDRALSLWEKARSLFGRKAKTP